MNSAKKQSWNQAVSVWIGRAGGWAVLKSAGLWCLLVALGSLLAPAQEIRTVAGGGPNNLVATAANLNQPTAIAQDQLGNFYIASPHEHVVYKIDTAGTLTVFAGTGTLGFSGDGGPATSAGLDFPEGVFVDGAGNVLIADTFNHRIRKVDSSAQHLITTVAGNGTADFSGDGGPATSAALNRPFSVSVDGAGNIFIADTFNSRIRKVDTSGKIQTVAGSGTAGFGGDGGAATSAGLNFPESVFVDVAGNIFIADTFNHRIRKVDTSSLHIITTVAGNGTPGFTDNVAAINAELNQPEGVFVDNTGNVFIADTFNNRIREVDSTGNIQTVAGTGTADFSGDTGPATSATLNLPFGVFVDSAGSVFIADTSNNRMRKVDTSGQHLITTVAGNGTQRFSGDGGPATSAALFSALAIFVDRAGNIFIADTNNHRIRKVDTSGKIQTVAGNDTQGFGGDGGAATNAMLNHPSGVFVDGAGNIFISDTDNQRIRKVDTTNKIQTVAGNGTTGFTGDGGAAVLAALNSPSGISVDSAGNIFFADFNNNRIRKVDTSSLPIITTVAGNGTAGFSGDGGPATSASLNLPNGVFVDGTGNLFIADTNNRRIRKVDTSGTIQTVAGGGTPADGLGDGGPSGGAELANPIGVFVDSAGNIFIADPGDQRVREVDHNPLHIITTVAGNGTKGFSGDGGPATSAELNGPNGVALDGAGNIFITDVDNFRIRKVVVADFAIAAASNTATVKAGQTASYGLSLSATGATQTLAVSCTGAPAAATCNVPATVTVTPGTTVPLNVSVTTTARKKGGGTPQSTSTLTVTATSTANGLSHSTQLTLAHSAISMRRMRKTFSQRNRG